ncbi:MAG: nucleotidyltransferase domain-containing protein [Pseudomonadota bacterium]|nr:nucleotidyltransferase domain-containing protein [Pseudomonadota bacterium]
MNAMNVTPQERSHVLRLKQDAERARQAAWAHRVENLSGRVREVLASTPGAPITVYLFGSWATGRFDGESDTDLLVIAPTEKAAREVQRRLMDVGDDVVAFCESDWERRLSARDPFICRVSAERLLLAWTGDGQDG